MSRFPAIGGGGESNPIADKDRAVTFEEADVTVTSPNSDAGINNQGLEQKLVRFGSHKWYDNGSPASFTVDDPSALSVVLTDQGGYSYTVTDTSINGTTVGSSLGEFSLDGFSSPYNVEVSFTSDSTTGYNYYCDAKLATGTAYIEWPKPAGVFRWDAATFNRSQDGGSVDLYIEMSADGGSTWEEVTGPIERGQRIDVPADARVRLRVEFSRSDYTTTPRLDSAYRRWVV